MRMAREGSGHRRRGVGSVYSVQRSESLAFEPNQSGKRRCRGAEERARERQRSIKSPGTGASAPRHAVTWRSSCFQRRQSRRRLCLRRHSQHLPRCRPCLWYRAPSEFGCVSVRTTNAYVSYLGIAERWGV